MEHTDPSLVYRAATVADGLGLMQKRYPARLRMGRHAHDEWRFCLALRGSYTDSWRRGTRTRTPWQLSLHPAGEVHTTVFHSSATCFHIELARHWRERLLGDFGITNEPHEFLAGRLPLLAGQLYDEFRHADVCSPLILEGLACELIGWTARALRRDGSGPPWVYKARDLLHDRFREPLRLQQVADELGIHPVHLARSFRREFGCTIGEYVRRIRVEFVSRQLRTDAKLTDLAFEAGFSDQSHLTRVFKRLTGLTPKQYRLGS